MNRYDDHVGHETWTVSLSPRKHYMKCVKIGPVAFEEMFETVTVRESLVKGQTMTLTSCSHK